MGHADYKISVHPDYVLVEGPDDYEIVMDDEPAELIEMSAVCKKAGRRKVLILGSKTKVRLSVMDILELGRRIADMGLEIAVVESHDASDEDVDFLENVAWNRGGLIKFFDSQLDAEEWLGVS